MSVIVEVSLPSGKTVTVQAGLNETVETLTQRACIGLGVGNGRLVDCSGVVQNGCAEITNTRIRNGDSLTLLVNRIQVRSNGFSFAAILGDGSVVTWGKALYGGDSSAVRTQLKNVQQIQASDGALLPFLVTDPS